MGNAVMLGLVTQIPSSMREIEKKMGTGRLCILHKLIALKH